MPAVQSSKGNGGNNASSSTTQDEGNLSTSVDSWLYELRPDYVELYSKAFNEEGFDSMDAIKTLTAADLEKMHIKTGHQRVILAAVDKLKIYSRSKL